MQIMQKIQTLLHYQKLLLNKNMNKACTGKLGFRNLKNMIIQFAILKDGMFEISTEKFVYPNTLLYRVS